jgi:hypothetical protein
VDGSEERRAVKRGGQQWGAEDNEENRAVKREGQ